MKKVFKALAASVTLTWALVYTNPDQFKTLLNQVEKELEGFPENDQDAKSLLSGAGNVELKDIIDKIFTFSETMAKHGYELERASIKDPAVKDTSAYKKFSLLSALCVDNQEGSKWPQHQEKDNRLTFVKNILVTQSSSRKMSLVEWVKTRSLQQSLSLEEYLQGRTIFRFIRKYLSTNQVSFDQLFSSAKENEDFQNNFTIIYTNLEQAYEKMKDEDKYVVLFLDENYFLLKFASSIDDLNTPNSLTHLQTIKNLLFGGDDLKYLFPIMINFYTMKAFASKYQSDLHAVQEFIKIQLKKLGNFVEKNEGLQVHLQNYFNKEINHSFLSNFEESCEATIKALLAVFSEAHKIIKPGLPIDSNHAAAVRDLGKSVGLQLQSKPTLPEIEEFLNSETKKSKSGGRAGEKTPSGGEQLSEVEKAAIGFGGAVLVISGAFAVHRLYKSYQKKARIARVIAQLKKLSLVHTQEKIDKETYLQKRSKILDAYAQSPEEREEIVQGAPA